MKISKSVWDQLVRTLTSNNEALATDAFVRFYYLFCPELESALLTLKIIVYERIPSTHNQ